MGSKGKKILEEIHPIAIIAEVQKWPILYQIRDNPDRSNFQTRQKVWHEIAKVLFTEWDSFPEWEKEAKVTDLMKKWRNLRDTFRRQLETEKKIREGHNIKKKTYVYFKHMLFLLPHIAAPEEEAPDPTLEPKLNEFFTRSAKRKASSKKSSLRKRKRSERHAPIQSVIIPETPTKSTDTEESIDEDKHFLMSLVPSFKRMSDDEKLEAKMGILKVIKGVRKTTHTNQDSLHDSWSYNLVDTDYNTESIKVEHDEDPDNSESQSNVVDSDENSD